MLLQSALAADDVLWAEQSEQLGTGHTVAQAVSMLSKADQTLVLYGDISPRFNFDFKKTITSR